MELIAEVHALRMMFFRTRGGQPSIIGSTFPLPLYWQQYADHEDPERNLSSMAAVAAGATTARSVAIVCTGVTASGAATSRYHVTVAAVDGGRYEIHVDAELRVAGAAGWLVTPNPHHGELEFCDLWPEGSFVPGESGTKRYQMHAVRRAGDVVLIPHHHCESDDKHNILMHAGDEAAWLIEDDNPVVRIESSSGVAAGICAYMWDMHFAYAVCQGGEPVRLPRGFIARARFSLRSMPRNEAGLWMRVGTIARPGGLADIPVHVRGVHTFADTFATADLRRTDLWPWTFEALEGRPGQSEGRIDREKGYDDRSSLMIRAIAKGSGRWVLTTLGPAFSGPPFISGRRYRLTARVRTSGGTASLALAIHRSDAPGLYDPSGYEEFMVQAAPGGEEWALLAVETPPIVPAPDRIHCRLLHVGEGTSWFDNVLFEECE